MNLIRVLVAEDESAVREALADLVTAASDMELVAAVPDAEAAISSALEALPDVALLDVKMPGGGGARAAREIRRGSPRTRIVALSAYDDRSTVVDMLRAGAAGYVVKGIPGSEIVDTIRRAVRGQGVLSVEVTADVIHELVAHLERSERLAQELRELDRTKTDLIQVLAHELFTPITTIQGFAMTVSQRGGEMDPVDARSLADGVERASHRLRRLVGNLRATAQLDREGVHLPTRPVAIAEVLHRCQVGFGSEERIQVADLGSAHRVWADSELAAQALAIVVENALDLSPADAPVELSVHRGTGTELQVVVADLGPGIPEEQAERVFEAFAQIEDPMTRSHEGLGIGLYLARQIMRAFGGDLTANPRPGGGTLMTLTFAGLDERS